MLRGDEPRRNRVAEQSEADDADCAHDGQGPRCMATAVSRGSSRIKAPPGRRLA
jgi:hypothetical protein